MTDAFTSQSSLLVLSDGRLLVRNVTPELSALLLALQPENTDLAARGWAGGERGDTLPGLRNHVVVQNNSGTDSWGSLPPSATPG